jgi:hypothetical protein
VHRKRVWLGAAVAFVCSCAPAWADSFNPVQLQVAVAPVARLHVSLPITVTVTADPSVLDNASSPLRIRAKLAGECGASFSTTPGDVLIDQRLNPQPTTGHAYSATAHGAGRPSAYGERAVCAYLEEEGDNRMFANNTADPPTVNVSRACTSQAGRYDAARSALSRARRQLRRAHGRAAKARAQRVVVRRTRTVNADRRSARTACGPGVAL